MDQDPGGNNGGRPRDDGYWMMYLAAAIGGALVMRPYEHSKVTLKRALQDFTRSRSCTDEVRDLITHIQQVKGETHRD